MTDTTHARSTFFFRIRRRSVQMPADGRPPLRLQHSRAPRPSNRQDTGHYDVCESPYLYGWATSFVTASGAPYVRQQAACKSLFRHKMHAVSETVAQVLCCCLSSPKAFDPAA